MAPNTRNDSANEWPSEEEPVVAARDLVKLYERGQRTVRALDGVSLAVRGGEFVAVIGKSGAGKSTLLHVIGALDQPTSGSVLLAGDELVGMPDRRLADLRRRRVGFVFQAFNLLRACSAAENVALPMVLDGVPRSDAKQRAHELLISLDLGDRVDHQPAELSGGECQRVAIARALALDPDVILADEPTGNLDTQSGAGILSLLRHTASDRGTAVVVATHDPAVRDFADVVLQMRDGRLVDGTPTGTVGRSGEGRVSDQASKNPTVRSPP